MFSAQKHRNTHWEAETVEDFFLKKNVCGVFFVGEHFGEQNVFSNVAKVRETIWGSSWYFLED